MQHFNKQHQADIDKKINKKLSNTMRLNFAIWKFFTFFIHLIIQKYIIENFLKDVQNASVRVLMHD